MHPESPLLRLFRSLSVLALLSGVVRAQELEIHYINVGWGGSVLVRGPNGTTVLLEAGRPGQGQLAVVPYLQSIGIAPADGLDYVILGHRHTDHAGGLDEVILAGYDTHVANYENGSPATNGSYNQWVTATQVTTAGAPVPMPVGTVIQLGNGATMTCVARDGNIIGGATVAVTDENDRSIALLVQYGGFDYLWGSDLGGGNADQACTGRGFPTANVETPLIQAISPGGASPLISAGGIDVLHINHHGAETASSSNYVNLAKPAVGVISIGAGQGTTDQRPRIDVVEHVLLAEVPCVTVPPVLVLQTEEGNPTGPVTSYAGHCVGNVKISTNGVSTFTVSADGHVTVGPDERATAGLPLTLPLDDADTSAPVLAGVQVASVLATSATIAWTSDEPSSSIVRYGLTTSYGSSASAAGLVTNHGVRLTGLPQARLIHYRVESKDASGNLAVSADRTFRTGTIANYAPFVTTILQGSLQSGTFTQLSTNNNVFYFVSSTTSGTRTSDWYGAGKVPVPFPAGAALTVTYVGRNSILATQSLHLWDWNAAQWVQLDSRNVGQTKVLVSIKPASPAAYVSAAGEIRLRVLGTRPSSAFSSAGDMLRFSVESPGIIP